MSDFIKFIYGTRHQINNVDKATSRFGVPAGTISQTPLGGIIVT